MIKIILTFLLFLASYKPVAASSPVTIHFFSAIGCPRCADEEVFLEELGKNYDIEVIKYEVTGSRENVKLLEEVSKKVSANAVSGNRVSIPFTVIGETHIAGFLSEETTGKKIEVAVLCVIETSCQDIVKLVLNSNRDAQKPDLKTPDETTLDLPIIGKLSTKSLSLPVLTFVIALLDGFNPCAMWILLFLISLLLGIDDVKRRWILGTAFIIASGIMYFLFMTAWLNLFLFLGFVVWVRGIIGGLAIFSGWHNLRDYFKNKSGGCSTVGGERRKSIFAKIRKFVGEKSLALAVVGMIVLAFGVNLIELVCSAGLPAIYTQVLSLTQLPTWKYYLYMVFYILVFMADDLAVFAIAMVTLRATGIEGKYARASKLIGGVLILIIGILIIFKPEALSF